MMNKANRVIFKCYDDFLTIAVCLFGHGLVAHHSIETIHSKTKSRLINLILFEKLQHTLQVIPHRTHEQVNNTFIFKVIYY